MATVVGRGEARKAGAATSTEAPKQGFFSKALGFAKDLGVGVVKSLGETAARTITSQLSPTSSFGMVDPLSGVKEKLLKKIPEKVNLPVLGETSLKYSSKPLEAVGQAATDVLNVWMPGGAKAVAKAGLEVAAKKGVEQVGKEVVEKVSKEGVKQLVGRLAKRTALDAAMGAAYGASTELHEQKPTCTEGFNYGRYYCGSPSNHRYCPQGGGPRG
jgi:hypothetical protein